MNNSIPAVLVFTGKQNSISTERAFNQIKSLLENYAEFDLCKLGDEYARCEASIDDIDLMLSKIVR